jgi:DNA-binding CsgD family transcriptional regulator
MRQTGEMNAIVLYALKSAKLTPLQIFILGRFMDGLKQREIAEELGIAIPTVSISIKSSVKKLRKAVSIATPFNQVETNNI